MRNWLITLIFFGVVGMLILALFLGDGPSGAAIKEPGTVCCEFTLRDDVKTCAATAGQTCDVCRGICAAYEG